MPCAYELDRQHKLVISSAWGVLTGAEILDHQEKLIRDEAFNHDFSQIADFTLVTKTEVDAATVQRLAARELYNAQSRRAFVATSATVIGLARMFETYRELAGGHEKIRIFPNREDALEWLSAGRAATHA